MGMLYLSDPSLNDFLEEFVIPDDQAMKAPRDHKPEDVKSRQSKPTEESKAKPKDDTKPKPKDKPEEDEIIDDEEVQPQEEKPRLAPSRPMPEGAAQITEPMKVTMPTDDVIEFEIVFDGVKPTSKWTIDGKNPSLNRDATVTVKDNVATLRLKNKDKYVKSEINFTVENPVATANNTFAVKNNRPVVSESIVDKTIKKKSPSDEAPKIVTKFNIKRVKTVSIIEGKVGGKPTPTIKWYSNGQPLDPKDPVFKQTNKPDGTVSIEVPDKETENGLELVFVAENYLGTVDQSFVLLADTPKDLSTLDDTQQLMLYLSDPSLKDFLEEFVIPDDQAKKNDKPEDVKAKRSKPEEKKPKEDKAKPGDKDSTTDEA